MPKQLNFTSRPLLRGRAKTDKPISYRGGEILPPPKRRLDRPGEEKPMKRWRAEVSVPCRGLVQTLFWCLDSSCQHSSLNFHKPILTIFSVIFGLFSLSANKTSVPRTPDLERRLNIVSLRDPSEFGTSSETSEPVLAHGAYMGWWMLIVILSSAPFALVYVLILTQNRSAPGPGLDWSSLGCGSRGLRVLFLLPVLKPSSRGLASGASCTIRRWSYWRCCARSTPWCQTLFFLAFCTPSPFPLLLSLLTSLIWNPSRNSGGRRGRTHQLVMYSQCREKREGRLSNIWNTPVEFSGPRFFFVLWWKDSWAAQPEFYSPRYGSPRLSLSGIQLRVVVFVVTDPVLGALWGKVSYHTP